AQLAYAQLPLPVGWLVALAGYLYVSRRDELTADRDAVGLTGDPEAAIAGLVKLARLGLLPMDWSRWDEGLLTHPSTRQRVAAILVQMAGLEGAALWACYLGGFGVSFAVDLWLRWSTGYYGPALEPGLRAELAEAGIDAEALGRTLVAFAPAAEPCSFEGFS